MTGPSGARVLSLDSLVRLRRGRQAPGTPRRLPVPDGMTAPMGCDAVAVPARFGPLVIPRLPRVGCVYADEAHWWWLVPSDSDYALEWPSPARYAAGAVLADADAPDLPPLIHRPDGTLPYTPPIPLYLALCRLTGTTPAWSRPVTA
ncbi:hypothetical protein [Streptomyces capillispiralis]|uniref:Uncharacterized protein n=1 Tax=Streptomyces capillispiralis TaxID=68182 RepID=A0A561TM69_9ACTN|nr:hypothetical protein [Streptomyces capillispiralis]TWF88256.1 hypothetical protein FHX78_115277 [Streptomyces capillispiralis]GHH94310.1 hypothetical protein GCM10017779_47670 [Streptomyces capillispiralis]